MSDGPGPSGRGSTAAPRKSKFAPTVPGRRKKADDGSSQTAAEAAAANSEFAELIKAAGSEASWARGRGRGRGQQRYEVTFGGGSGDNKTASAPASRGYVGGSSRGGRGGSFGGRGAAAVAAAARAGGVKSEPEDDAAMDVDGLKLEASEPAGKPAHRNVLDFTQYYPTCLPPRQPYVKGELPGYEMSDGVKPVPVDLATTQDPEDRIAEDLHLLDLDDTEHMFLMQLPSVLPARATTTAAAAAAACGTRGGTAAGGASTSGAAARKAPVGSSGAAGGSGGGVVEVAGGSALRDLGSGQLGKLLVFRSGKVKLQMGDVLMDVSSGLTPLHRQDVAALNTNLGHCIMLGDVTQTAVVSPDVMQLIDTRPIPAFRRELLRRDDPDDEPAAVADGGTFGRLEVKGEET